ncbi:protein kinase domain-containing protein [Neorhodopirellula pilleata]|uniref:Serine/threonine-protein kinase PknH n=1 Tax=Neorhodopirellula pilleata TaxID=2714738 RepID=A0A5C6AB95_9BACT|nr:protein kinase [Neorhodopirellula pilleata]TWT96321.1 Serine/threonine-protein kinase PknH [Neorhodopirellula pilleata]
MTNKIMLTDESWSDCSSPRSATCLLRQLAESESGELDIDRCLQCQSTVAVLESEVQTVGKRLNEAIQSAGSDTGLVGLIEASVLSDFHSPSMDRCPITIGEYRIGSLIGRGGMGVVYRATHRRLERVVAMKLLASRSSRIGNADARFDREIKALGRLEHPNIVRALDAGQVGGIRYLIMELIHGTDLDEVVRRREKLAAPLACEIIRQAAVGLQYAHTNGLIHRDIKPSNLMIGMNDADQPIVKVLDLGIASLSDSDASAQLTDQGQLIGTLEFMAPEQASKLGDLNHLADVYALGATLYRLLAGVVPFSGTGYETPAKRLRGLMSERPPSIAVHCPQLPQPLIELVDRTLSTDPELRPQSMQQFAELLQPFCDPQELVGLCGDAKQRSQLESDHATIYGNSLSEPRPDDRHVDFRSGAHDAADAASQSPPDDLNPTRRRGIGRGVGLFGGLAMMAIAGVIWLQTTEGGYLKIEADPSIEVKVEVIPLVDDSNTPPLHVIRVGSTAGVVWLRSGQYKIRIQGEPDDDLSLDETQFELTRGELKLVQVRRTTVDGRHESMLDRATQNSPPDQDPSADASRSDLLVVRNVNDDGPRSLRDVLQRSSSGETIRFDAKLSGQTIRLGGNPIVIHQDVSIDASDLDEPITLDAGGLSQVLVVSAKTTVVFENLVVTGGRAGDAGDGGGIHAVDAKLTLRNVIVKNNKAWQHGGGISVVGDASRVEMVNCMISGNHAEMGSACLFRGGKYWIRNSTFFGNDTGYEAAIVQDGGQSELTNVTIANNSAAGVSGLLLCRAANTIVQNATISGNHSSTSAPSYAVRLATGSRMEIENSVIANNGSQNSFDLELHQSDSLVIYRGTNFIEHFESQFGHELPASVLTKDDASRSKLRLASLGHYGGFVQTMPPAAGSSLIDTGVIGLNPPTVDARFLPRPVDGDRDGEAVLDVGAVEWSPDKDAKIEHQKGSPGKDVEVGKNDRLGPFQRLLKIENVFLRNEGDTETLQRSSCQIIPFVTYSTDKPDSSIRQQGLAQWEQALASRDADKGNWFVLPSWMRQTNRIPLPAWTPTQKTVTVRCDEGHAWYIPYLNHTGAFVLSDNPETTDHDEALDVGFLFISRFATKDESKMAYEFKLLREMSQAFSNTDPQSYHQRELTTPRVRNLLDYNSRGLSVGKGYFMHYFLLTFIDGVPGRR